jgi:hypothetical protein
MSSNKRKGSVREYRTKRELLEFLKSEFLKSICVRLYNIRNAGARRLGRGAALEHSSILVNVNPFV